MALACPENRGRGHYRNRNRFGILENRTGIDKFDADSDSDRDPDSVDLGAIDSLFRDRRRDENWIL
jgi:hypothetical protein